jgi:hypothetical protein
LPVISQTIPLVIELELDSTTTIDSACLSLVLSRDSESSVTTVFTGDQNFQLRFEPGIQLIRCNLGVLPLAPGRYFVTAILRPSIHALPIDYVADVPVFDVKLPSVDQAALPWPQRPWGALHLTNVQWQLIK